MNPHALRVLEYDRIRQIVAGHAAGPLGEVAARALEPSTDPRWIRERLVEVDEMMGLLEVARVPLAGLRDVVGSIRALAEGGRPAEPDLLYQVLELLRGAGALREALTREPGTFPSLHRLGEGIEDLPPLRERIARTVDAREEVLDEASEKLAGLRREIHALRESIRERIGGKLSSPGLARALQHEGIKFKDDRYLLPVKKEYRSWVPGVIRDRSASGATLYIEPEDLVLDGDELLRLTDDERAEVRRILWELTREVLASEAVLARIQERVAAIDLTHAKARYARAFRLSVPEIVEPAAGFELDLRDARHPYLMWLASEAGREAGRRERRRAPGGRRGAEEEAGVDLEAVRRQVVPLDVRIDESRRLLIVTGPNTGGKTVALKTVGLNVLMAASGIPIAAAPASRVPAVSNLFADIGDEQSIEQSLSTFSSHLTQIETVFDEGDPSSLVLLDELGAGTDPLEGAALATALLDWFHRRGWHGIITTHLGSLKEFAFLNDGAENASMEFDPATLQPTFRMVIGLPGVSHALEIARRLGVPQEIVEDARERVETLQGPSREVIEKMVVSHRRMEKERRRMERLRQRAQGERRAAESEREVARAEREAWRKEAETLADDVIRSARSRLVPLLARLSSVPKQLQPVVDELRWTVELLLTETPLGKRREEFARSLRKEDEVYVPKFRERCRVRKVNKGDRVVTVLLNGIPTEVSFDDVSWLEEEAAGEESE